MNIFELAMKLEKEGEQAYRDLAAGTTNEGLKSIFTMLAEDEVKHYQTFLALSKSEQVEAPASNVLVNVRRVFAVPVGRKGRPDVAGQFLHVERRERGAVDAVLEKR